MISAVIHQPDFLPYLGFFHRLLCADVFVLLDTAQFVNGTSRSWMNRDKIKTPRGEQWLTVSVKKSPRDTSIKDIELSQTTDWKVDNLRLIQQNYQSAPYFAEIYPCLQKLYSQASERLAAFNIRSIEMLMELFDLHTELMRASDLHPAGNRNELLVDLLKKVKATRYISGVGAKVYFDPEPFEKDGIEVIWQSFAHPIYPQLHGPFMPYLSSIDLLFNCGIEQSRQILRGC